MASTTIGHMIFYIALFIIVMIALYALINTIVAQVAFWILRPSEMAAMDLVGTVTTLGGTTGDVTTHLRPYTENVMYYMKKSEKVICVISQRSQKTETPIVGVLTSFNCFSTPFTLQSDLPVSADGVESYEFELKKVFEDPFVNVNIKEVS